MKAGMAELRKMLKTSQNSEDGSGAVMFERLRGIVLNEEDDT